MNRTGPRWIRTPTLASLLAAGLAGCGTLATQVGDDHQGPWIYGGTYFDATVGYAGLTSDNEAGILALLWLDLPLSLCADTLILPLTIYQQLTREPQAEPAEADSPGPP